MPSTEVQRTLVKSPPELWAELSDPVSLARHLSELGEIQLTRIEPESAVEWEAEHVKGSVRLKTSGWGTKVTFSLTRELPQEAVAEPDLVGEPEQWLAEPELSINDDDSEPLAAEPEPSLATPERVMTEAEQEAVEPIPTPEPEATSRRSFFARLFRRRRKKAVTDVVVDIEQPEHTAEPEAVIKDPMADPAAPPAPGAAQEPAALEPLAGAPSEPPAEATQEPIAEANPKASQESETVTPEPQTEKTNESPDLAAELAAMEQAMVEQDTALLTAVLDRLGAAHHRPFSRG